MKKSFIRTTIILLVLILTTSALFFTATSYTYSRVYTENILTGNRSISQKWNVSIDSRLNTVYEHIYDLLLTLYNNADVRSGSLRMNSETLRKMQDAISSKVMSSKDINCLFLLDTESDIYYFRSNGFVSHTAQVNLKLFCQNYSLDYLSALTNRKWELIEILEEGYFFKAIQLGRYIIGGICDCQISPDDEYADLFRGDAACFFSKNGRLYPCQGSISEEELENISVDKDTVKGGYAVTVHKMANSDADLLFITRSPSLDMPVRLLLGFLVLDSAICFILVFILGMNLNRRLRNPINMLVSANQAVATGDLQYRLEPEKAGSEEFEELFRSFNDMSSKIGQLTIEQYDAKLKREENRLKMLRAQMRPHTYLNGITTISNLTYKDDPQQMREYISAFAKFIRYMLNTQNDWTTVGEELRHIDNYVKMQQIRFPNSIEIEYDVSNDIRICRMPYLLLFSLVENSFKHAMTLEETMKVRVAAEEIKSEDFTGIKIIEEDNGPGFSEQAMDKLETLNTDDLYMKEHLGLTNVRYTLNLIYHRSDLLQIENKEEGGARIVMMIPQQENEDETADMR
ncbi:MAG: histidine kinase [Erysipelotrichaceae bacterium]|nr:histidine kinase [Erysipelotrichaceae bacterium]